MKKTAFLAVLGLILLTALTLCRPSAGATSEPEMPEVTYLGEGPREFSNETGDFVVKTKNTQGQPWRFEVETGPTYSAKKGEKVWAITQGAPAPMRLFEETRELEMVETGCRVDYIVVDDDDDTRRVRFDINDNVVETTPQGMIAYGRLEITSNGQLSITTADSIGLWYGVLCEAAPTEYRAYMPIVNAPSAPPPPPVCEDAKLTASMAGQTAELPFAPWPADEVDYGIWGPNEVLGLTASRDVQWAMSRGGEQYHYLPVAVQYNLTGVYPWPETSMELWDTDPVTLLAIPDYHVRAYFTDVTGVLCQVSGWVQWDPPEENRMADMSAKPADLRPVFSK